MKLTKFTLFKNTPLLNLQNTIHFENNNQRDNFFSKNFQKKELSAPFNFRKDRGVLKISVSYENLMGYNYCQFIDGFDNKTYYAFIIGMTYLNDSVTRLDLLIDVVMTYTQGNILEHIGQVDVLRQHLPEQTYQLYLEEIRTNEDFPTTTTKRYVKQFSEIFKETYVLIYSTCDLTKDFGDAKKPKMPVSIGGTFDNITSPVDIYMIPREHFQTFSASMKDFPWIAQNISKCFIIPKKFLKDDQLIKTTTSNGFEEIYKLKYDSTTISFESEISFTKKQLLDLLSLSEKEDYLLKKGYATIELTDFRGQTLALDLSILEQIKLKYISVLGYRNEIRVIPVGYGDRLKNGDGFSLNFSLGFTQFDELPILINNGDLSLAKSAYSRNLGNDRTISGRLNKITSANSNIQDRVFNSLSVFSDVFSGGISGALSKSASLYANEYEHYRDQNAQIAEAMLSTPTVTNQSTENSLLVKANLWGLHLKVSTLSVSEQNKVKQYYNLFGFQMNKRDKIYTVDSMEKCNWLQFKGSWKLPDVDVESMNILRTLFEGGIRFWHYRNGKYGSNPMEWQEVYTNERIK